jgi:hypothetical protein
VDVRAVFRRARLPLVASLFLAALLGAPAVAATPALDPLPARVTVLAAAAPTSTTATEPTAAEPAPAPAPAADTTTVAYPAARVLLDRSGTAAGAPRAPPFSA